MSLNWLLPREKTNWCSS